MDRRIGVFTLTSLVIASMVGTGVFTSTGFQVADIQNNGAILFAWVIGGLTALSGALSYAELAAAFPHNGGEYHLLGRIYHRSVGFVMGWISVIVGFAAPIAAAALAFGRYAHSIYEPIDPNHAAFAALITMSMVHVANTRFVTRFQDATTSIKIVLIVAFIVLGLAFGNYGELMRDRGGTFIEGVASSKFAVTLIYVAFAYSGWNSAAYVAGEVENPGVRIQQALIAGTLTVMLLYGLLNIVFLASAPAGQLSGVVEIGHVAATHLFGEKWAVAISIVIAGGLISTIGAMIMTGARVLEAIGRDHATLRIVTERSKDGGPWVAVLILSTIATAMLASASFDALLEYIGFTLTMGVGATVFGVFVLRYREPDLERPVRTWGYPFTPAVFIALASWMTVGLVMEKPRIALAGLATLALGFGVWWVVERGDKALARS